MRIVVADYSGHPFQAQLSRELAKRGHAVLHLYFMEFQTPRGRLTLGPDDARTLAIEPILLGKPFAKHRLIQRRFQEVAIGKLFAKRIAAFKADVVIGSNLPLDALSIVARRTHAAKCPFIFWQQDIYSIGIERIMKNRWGTAGAIIGKYYKKLEAAILRESQAVIAISDDFIPYLKGVYGIADDRLHVIENWAPLDEITPQPKDNKWARAHGLQDKDVVLYSGTIGMKHDPAQIIGLASALRDRPNTEVVVLSEGPAATRLAQKARESRLRSLRVIGFQPYELYSEALGTADVLFCILERGSGAFSVPSKVLSYLCAGRPIVMSGPEENLAARIIKKSSAGQVVRPGDSLTLGKVVRALLDNPTQRKTVGDCGRHYAQKAFNIERIGNRFETIAVRARNADRSISPA